MSHTTGHVGHWEDLETWLSIATDSLLPKAAETLKHQTQDQLDDNITSLMAQDPSQVKSSHLYLYSAFNNTNCDKAIAQYQNGKIVSIM